MSNRTFCIVLLNTIPKFIKTNDSFWLIILKVMTLSKIQGMQNFYIKKNTNYITHSQILSYSLNNIVPKTSLLTTPVFFLFFDITLSTRRKFTKPQRLLFFSLLLTHFFPLNCSSIFQIVFH